MGKVKEQLLDNQFDHLTPKEPSARCRLSSHMQVFVDTNVSETSVILEISDDKVRTSEIAFLSKEDALNIANQLIKYANNIK